MGKRGAWIHAVKKAIICESKQKSEKKIRKSGRCFRKQRSSVDLDSSSSAGPENALVVVPTSDHSPLDQDTNKLVEAENEQNRHAYSVALVTAMAAEAAVAAAHAAAEVVRLRSAACNSSKTKEDVAAVKIQTAFRGYLARRVLRALRGLMRLKSIIGGQSVKRQSVSTLKCMQTLSRLQSEIRSRRITMSDDNSVIQRQIQQKHEKELAKSRLSVEGNWDDSVQSKEQIEANLHYRQEAAMRRERALAYAYSHQQTWRNSSNSANQTFMDPNNPRWGWNWLERWMAARPWENGQNVVVLDKELNGDRVSSRSASTRSISAQSPTVQKQSPRRNKQFPSTPKSRTSAGKIRGTRIDADDDSRSLNSTQSEQFRRNSNAGLSVRDDESLASSPAVPCYMSPTESARAKSRLGTPERAKKRLSFTGSSPSGPRRHSAPARTSDAASPAKS